jgi:hypothetical protein
MSTKIYNAYRINKNHDLKDLLKQMREIACEEVAKDAMFLKAVWRRCVAIINQQPESATWKDDFKQEYGIYQFEKVFFESRLDNDERIADGSVVPAIWFDSNWWYLKFFSNSLVARNIEKRIAALSCVEDYHYQNQTDAPDSISEKDFAKRGRKWDTLLDEDDSFSSFMTLPVFTHHQFTKLVQKQWYTGTKDLYSHLAYQFDDL